ncbi:hypothetical protein WJX72_000380 [[Myrmecia] bisecta]|uniref:Uncharacterized protein n=1 Tax=[Myrmecia] bisecta TaxID=41462 RepID=A0AAW1P043_9CHLO
MQVLEDTHIRVVKENVYVESHLDKVFDQDASQEDVYTASKDCIQAALDGYNSCICAYGPTGTGKTYTMFGDPRLGVEDAAYGQDALAGVIPRALVELFERTQSHASASTSATTASLSVSYMEIYNEKIHDLLQPYKPRDKRAPQDMVQKKAGLEVKDRGSQGTFVKGLSARRITTVQQALDVVRKGDQHRAVRHTEMNQHSSRSHTILQVILEQRVANESGLCLLRSKLNFVDLAGSERWNAHHELTDERISEMTSINQSLSALITVVGKLAEEGTTHVPYRDSKLTHLLQDSLGGNSKTLIIATVSPSSAAFEETCSTLKFADRARNIVNRATVNLRLDLKQELALKAAEVRRLQQLVIKYATAMGTGTSTAAPDTAGIVAQLQAEVAGLRSDLVVAKQMLAVERAARRALESRQSSQASEDGAPQADSSGDVSSLTKMTAPGAGRTSGETQARKQSPLYAEGTLPPSHYKALAKHAAAVDDSISARLQCALEQDALEQQAQAPARSSQRSRTSSPSRPASRAWLYGVDFAPVQVPIPVLQAPAPPPRPPARQDEQPARPPARHGRREEAVPVLDVAGPLEATPSGALDDQLLSHSTEKRSLRQTGSAASVQVLRLDAGSMASSASDAASCDELGTASSATAESEPPDDLAEEEGQPRQAAAVQPRGSVDDEYAADFEDSPAVVELADPDLAEAPDYAADFEERPEPAAESAEDAYPSPSDAQPSQWAGLDSIPEVAVRPDAEHVSTPSPASPMADAMEIGARGSRGTSIGSRATSLEYTNRDAEDHWEAGVRVIAGKYEVVQTVGEGAYGTVMLCRLRGTDQQVAVKEYKIEESDEDVAEVRRTTLREVALLRRLQHPHIIGYIEDFTIDDGRRVFLVMEHVPRTLLNLMESAADDSLRLPRATVRQVISQLVSAIAFLHSSGVIYRDIKPENMLIGADGDIRLCDFGFARWLPSAENAAPPLSDYVGTRWYRPVELLLGAPYSGPDGHPVSASYGAPVDMWAIGCIMAEMVDGEPLFPGDSDIDQLYRIQRLLGPLTPAQQAQFEAHPRHGGVNWNASSNPAEASLRERYVNLLSEDELSFLEQLLCLDPAKRMTAAQSMQHPYLAALASSAFA